MDNNEIGKGIGTFGIWLGMGIISVVIRGTPNVEDVLPVLFIVGAVATGLIWVFG